MSPKSVAFLVVGMLVISSVFFMFHVAYPSNPATIKLNPPKNVQPPNLQIFQNQTINSPHLGLNQTSFSATGNTTMTLEGYVFNSTSGQALANQKLGVAVMQAFTTVITNATGYYSIKIKATGQGMFAFKVFQYATKLYNILITPGITSLKQNIELNPELKYPVSGFTQSHGNDISSVGLIFKDFWGFYSTQSTPSGSYSINMVDGSYNISDQKQGFSPIPNPINVTVNNASRNSYDLQLYSTNQAALYMSGYVFNELHDPVGGANISVVSPAIPNGSAITNSMGYYNISVAYYSNTISIIAQNYTPYQQTVIVTKNTTNQNFTITSLDPFSSITPTGSQLTGPSGLGPTASNVNYAKQQSVSISGKVILTQTGMPVTNQQFIVYTSVNGTYFYDQIQTDGGGNYTISLNYHGDYSFAITSMLYYEAWLNKTVDSSLTGVPIYVTTANSNVYHLSGNLYNGVTNVSLSNATINITSPTGQYLGTVNVSANGSFSFNVTGGNYVLNISAPGFGSTNYPITVTGNQSNLNISLNPSTGVTPGSSQWTPTSGSGLPGVNGTSITSQINATQNTTGSPTTTSGTPVLLHLQMDYVNNSQDKPIVNTSYVLFIKVNGIYLRISNTTNSTGGALLPLEYGGTYIILPEMIDYSGNATFVNTSSVSQPILFIMKQLPLFSLQVNLSNPLGIYGGSQVPISGLTGDGYYLPIKYSSYYQSPTNYTLANYSLPNGTYTFKYNNTAYVPIDFNVSVNGTTLSVHKLVNPYALSLAWNTPISWSYSLTGNGLSGLSSVGVSAGSSSQIFSLSRGSFDFTAFLQSNTANTSSFTLSTTNNVKYLSFSVNSGSWSRTNISWTYNHTNLIFSANSSVFSSKQVFINEVELNANLTNDSSLYISTTGSYTWSGGNTLPLTNYFATTPNVETTITIVSHNYQLNLAPPSGVIDLTVYYYSTILAG